MLYSQPFTVPEAIDNIFVTDSSALSRFFECRNLNLKMFDNAVETDRPGYSIPLLSQWAGTSPSPDDLIHMLKNPIQFKLMKKQLSIALQPFHFNESTADIYSRYVRKQFSVEDYVATIRSLGTASSPSGTE